MSGSLLCFCFLSDVVTELHQGSSNLEDAETELCSARCIRGGVKHYLTIGRTELWSYNPSAGRDMRIRVQAHQTQQRADQIFVAEVS